MHRLTSSLLNETPRGLSSAAMTVRVLGGAGVIRPMSPRKIAGLARALNDWGTGPAGGFATLAVTDPDRVGLVDELGDLTFGEIHRRSNALARGLGDLGVRQGDSVAVMCRNHRGFVDATIAVEDSTHATFWRRLVRWLVDGVPDPVALSTAVDRVEPGEPAPQDPLVDHPDAAAAMAPASTAPAPATSRPSVPSSTMPSARAMSATALPSATACSLDRRRTPRTVSTPKNSSMSARSSPRTSALRKRTNSASSSSAS